MELLNAAEAAAYLHLHVKRVQALARAGKLPGRRVGRKWLFERRDLDALLERPAATDSDKETNDDASRSTGLDISARNQLRGHVISLVIEGVMAEVRLRIGGQELVSIITRSSAERLNLRVGDRVVAVIKSTEVMIGKGAALA